jgi:hypothetical protein
MVNTYDDSEPAEYEENLNAQVEDDEIDSAEEGFMKGYEEDEENSFRGDEKKKDEEE